MILSGSSNQPLAQKLAKKCKAELGDVSLLNFANGEQRVRIQSDVASKEIVLVQSFSDPVDKHIMQFLLLTDALERAGVQQVTAVIPWLGYSLQDKVFLQGEAIAARVVADLISNAFVHKVALLDLHNPSIAGFFSVPTIHVSALSLFVSYVQKTFDLDESIVVSPDFGGLKRARVFADRLSLSLVNIDKHRDLQTGKVEPRGISGEVKDRVCFVFDDVVNTGGTVVEVARFLKLQGAKQVHFCVTHGLFAGNALKNMSDDALDSVIITDSIHHPELPENIKVLSVDGVLSERV